MWMSMSMGVLGLIGQHILLRLVHGTPCALIPANIVSVFAASIGIELGDIPPAHFCRNCLTVLQNCGKTLAVFRIAKAGH